MTDSTTFRAMVVRKQDDGTFARSIETRSTDDLPPGDVLVRVAYSSLNYKDALSATGNPGVTREYPHTPGIDAAGTVEASSSDAFRPGDAVVVIGHDLGMETDGGFGGFVRVPADWVVRLPEGLTARESMVFGTAGFTAGMAVRSLVDHGVEPGRGEVLVTGATGGVGSMAVAILARAGYAPAAVTGKPDAAAFLKELGAASVHGRDDVTDTSRPLARARWAGVVDCVGGDMLASALAATDVHGAVAITGLVASPKLNTTVFPFILRGITMIGIDSQRCNVGTRPEIWATLATSWKPDGLDRMARDVALDALDPEIDRILAGGQTGRVVVRH